MHLQGGDLWFNQAAKALADLWEGDCELTPENFKWLIWSLLNMNLALQMSLADIHAHVAQLGQTRGNGPRAPLAPADRTF